MNSKPVFLAALALAFGAPAFAQSRIEHVLLVSVDGLHASDLARYVANKPKSALAELAARGVTYSNARTTFPSDSFPGLLALLTGGTPRETGVWYDDAFAGDFASPKSCKPGAKPEGVEYDYSEAIDVDEKIVATRIDPAKLVADPARTCEPVWPHSLVRVNNVFDVAKAAGLRTAWSDKHPAYDLVQGPTGKAVDQLHTPEINGEEITDSVDKTIAYDADKAKVVVNWIKGLDTAGLNKVGAPAIFGMNFQAVSVAQKNKGNGYKNAEGEPSAGLAQALDATDAALGRLAAALTAEKLDASTLFIVTAKHGQSPIDPAKRRIVDGKSLKKVMEDAVPGVVAQATTDDVALVWLKDKSKTAAVIAALNAKKAELAIDRIVPGAELADPATDPRAPDFIVQPVAGVIYTKPTATKLAEHGGGTDDDRRVALLASNPAIKAAKVDAAVSTTQVAPSILATLGLDPRKLDAARANGAAELPSLAAALGGK